MNKAVRVVVFIISALGAIKWGFIGLFNFDLVEILFGHGTIVSKFIYFMFGICGLILLFKCKDFVDDKSKINNTKPS